MGGKLFAIPWDALQLDAANKRFVLDVAQERLEQAPGSIRTSRPRLRARFGDRRLAATGRKIAASAQAEVGEVEEEREDLHRQGYEVTLAGSRTVRAALREQPAQPLLQQREDGLRPGAAAMAAQRCNVATGRFTYDLR